MPFCGPQAGRWKASSRVILGGWRSLPSRPAYRSPPISCECAILKAVAMTNLLTILHNGYAACSIRHRFKLNSNSDFSIHRSLKNESRVNAESQTAAPKNQETSRWRSQAGQTAGEAGIGRAGGEEAKGEEGKSEERKG